MSAVVEFGGKQYLVSVGDVINTELISADLFNSGVVSKDSILAFGKDGEVCNAKVNLSLIKTFKDDKIIIFKKNRRHNYRRKRGHRQNIMALRVEEIVF